HAVRMQSGPESKRNRLSVLSRLPRLLARVVPVVDVAFLVGGAAGLAAVEAPIGEPGPGEAEAEGLAGLLHQVHLRGGVALDVLDDLGALVGVILGALASDHA